MPVVETRYEHIALNEEQVPIIAGTTMKVKELVAEKMGWGWGPEEMKDQHPYLTLGQIHSALAYYWDHREEMEAEIERDLEEIAEMQREAGPSPLVARLKQQGLL